MITLSTTHKSECECQGGRPSFPDTGIITWKGVASKEIEHWAYPSRPRKIKWKNAFEGQMYKDENGLFILKHRYPYGWHDTRKTMLRIVVPNGDGTFTQISR